MKISILGLLALFLFAGNIADAKSKKDDDKDKVNPETYDIKDGLVTDFAFLKLSKNYYDPGRMDPKEMLDAGLEALEDGIAEFDYEMDEQCQNLTLRVPSKENQLVVGGVNSPWEVATLLKKAYALISENIEKNGRNFYQIETEVVHEMLQTLDPYSRASTPLFKKKKSKKPKEKKGELGVDLNWSRRPPCNGKVTIQRVLPNTSAERVGLVPGDQILRINDVAVADLNENELFEQMGGKLGSLLKLELHRRDGRIQTISTVRGRYYAPVVEWELLPENIGYIRLKEFGGNAIAEFTNGLLDLHAQGMKGLVFDLRGNGGGSAYIANRLVNLFIEIGTIETFYSKQSEDDKATFSAVPEDTEPLYPMAILVDGGSASASELMSGALRHHGRALLIGDSTFGKGSAWTTWKVPGGGTLGLTIARYDTPGQVSIQEVGIEPDVRLKFAALTKDDVYLKREWNRERESDRDTHIERGESRERTDRAPAIESTVVLPKSDWQEHLQRMESCDLEDGWESFEWKYMKEFARRAVAHSKGHTMEMMTVAASEILGLEEDKNKTNLLRSMKNIGVDWAPSPRPSQASSKDFDANISVKTQIVGAVRPGERFKVRVQVKNRTSKTIYRLRGETKNDWSQFEGYEFLFGRVGPGQTKAWTTQILAPESDWRRTHMVEIEFEAQDGPLPKTAEVLVAVPAKPAPEFSYSWRFEDKGNGDLRLEAGETVLMHTTVTNVGPGTTADAELRIQGSPGVEFKKSKHLLGKIAPGKTIKTTFKFKIDKDFDEKKAKLVFEIADWKKHRYTDEPVELLQRPIVLPVVPKTKMGKKKKKKQEVDPGSLEIAITRAPLIDLKDLPEVSESKDIVIEGTVSHEKHILDLAVFVDNRKVHYLHNGDVKDQKKIEFKVPIQLDEGTNTITVRARHDDYDVADSSVDVYVPFAKKLTDEEKKTLKRRCPL